MRSLFSLIIFNGGLNEEIDFDRFFAVDGVADEVPVWENDGIRVNYRSGNTEKSLYIM